MRSKLLLLLAVAAPSSALAAGACVSEDPTPGGPAGLDSGAETSGSSSSSSSGSDGSSSDARSDAAPGRSADLVDAVSTSSPSALVGNSANAFWLAGGAIKRCVDTCSVVVPGGATSVAVDDTYLFVGSALALSQCPVAGCDDAGGAAWGAFSQAPASPRLFVGASVSHAVFAIVAGQVVSCSGGACGNYIATSPIATAISAANDRLVSINTTDAIFCTASSPSCSGTVKDGRSGMTAVHVTNTREGFIAVDKAVYDLPDNVVAFGSASHLADFGALMTAGERIVDLASDGTVVYALVDSGNDNGARILKADLSPTPNPRAHLVPESPAGVGGGTARHLQLVQNHLYFSIANTSAGKEELYRVPK